MQNPYTRLNEVVTAIKKLFAPATPRVRPSQKPTIHFKGIAYVAGPYRGKSLNEIHENIESSRAAAAQLWRRGYVVICPHMNTAFMDGIGTDEVFLQGDLALLKLCDLLVLLPTWQQSAGATAEREFAIRNGIKIIDCDAVLREPVVFGMAE